MILHAPLATHHLAPAAAAAAAADLWLERDPPHHQMHRQGLRQAAVLPKAKAGLRSGLGRHALLQLLPGLLLLLS